MEKASHIASGTPLPGRNEEGPAAWGADRAWEGADNQEPPTEADAASVGQSRRLAALAFPGCKAESTAAARLALIGWALNRAELASAYVATRWDSEPVMLADLAAATAFADSEGAPA